MVSKIQIRTEVLRNLARDYDAYGEAVWQSSQTARRQLEQEYETLLRKYSAYPDVTSKIHEIRSRLRQTEQRVRELRERSEEVAQRLRRAADECERQQERERNLIRALQAGFAKIHVPTIGSVVKSGLRGIGDGSSLAMSIGSGAIQAVWSVKVTLNSLSDQIRKTSVEIGEKVNAKLKNRQKWPDSYNKASGILGEPNKVQVLSYQKNNGEDLWKPLSKYTIGISPELWYVNGLINEQKKTG